MMEHAVALQYAAASELSFGQECVPLTDSIEEFATAFFASPDWPGKAVIGYLL